MNKFLSYMKEKWMYWLVIVVLVCVFMVPSISLRVAVLFASPKSAFTMEYHKVGIDDEGYTIYEITKNIPHADDTDSDLVYWYVKHYGPICISGYYGY